MARTHPHAHSFGQPGMLLSRSTQFLPRQKYLQSGEPFGINQLPATWREPFSHNGDNTLPIVGRLQLGLIFQRRKECITQGQP